MNKELYISVDVEAAGVVPEKYSMLSLGAVVVEDQREEFYRDFKPVNFNFEKSALKVCRNSFSEDILRRAKEINKKTESILYALQDLGAEPVDAMDDFNEWVKKVSKGRRPVFVGYNASFDWQFINFYFEKYIGKNPFGYDPIDIKSYFMGKRNVLWEDVTKPKVLKFLKMGKNDLPHNALFDAKEQAEIFRELLKIK